MQPEGPYPYSYHLISRTKKSKPWIELAFTKSNGDSCNASGEAYIISNFNLNESQKEMIQNKGVWKDSPWIKHEFYSLFRVVDGVKWHKMQVSAHLKAVGVKRR